MKGELMTAKTSTINEVAKIFCQAVKEVLESSTGSKIRYAPTIQKVPSISLKPDLGCFVQFSGDYSGLFIMNLCRCNFIKNKFFDLLLKIVFNFLPCCLI